MRRGVTLLLSVLISSVALALGVGVFTIILGQIGIAGTIKESLVAFYAADSGAECALYWDLKQNFFNSPSAGVLKCGGTTPAVTILSTGAVTTTQLSYSLHGGACASVRVTKTSSFTTVTSLGENTNCGVFGERTVQRGLEVTY